MHRWIFIGIKSAFLNRSVVHLVSFGKHQVFPWCFVLIFSITKSHKVKSMCVLNELQVMTFNNLCYFFSGYVFVNRDPWEENCELLGCCQAFFHFIADHRTASGFQGLKGSLGLCFWPPEQGWPHSSDSNEKYQWQGAMQGQNSRACITIFCVYS